MLGAFAEEQYELQWIWRSNWFDGPLDASVDETQNGEIIAINRNNYEIRSSVVILNANGALKLRKEFPVQQFSYLLAQSASDGNVIVSSDDGTGHVGKYNLGGGEIWTRDLGVGNTAVGLCKDNIEGFWVLVEGSGRKVIWFAEDGTKKFELSLTDSPIKAFPFATGGIDLISMGDVRHVSRINATGAVWTKPLPGDGNEFMQTIDGGFFGYASIWVSPGVFRYRFSRCDTDWNLVFDKDGSAIDLRPGFVFGDQGSLKRIDANSGTVSTIAPFDYRGQFFASRDGGLISVNQFVATGFDSKWEIAKLRKKTVPEGAPQISVGPRTGNWWDPPSLNGAVPATNFLRSPSRNALAQVYSSNPAALIYYTTDGSDPTSGSRLYAGPVELYASGIFRAAAYIGQTRLEATPVNVSDGLEAIAYANVYNSVSITGIDVPGTTATTYPSNSVITVTANEGIGWTFHHWAGDFNGRGRIVQKQLTRNVTAIAYYATPANINVVGGHGKVVRFPDQDSYVEGSSVRFALVPDPGYRAATSISVDKNPYVLRIDSPNWQRDVTFEEIPAGKFGLTVLPNGNGDVTVTPMQTAYDPGQTVQITAKPANGANFYRFSGTVENMTNVLTLTADQHHVIWANFSLAQPEFVGPSIYFKTETVRRDGENFLFWVTNSFGGNMRIQRSTDFQNWVDAPGIVGASSATISESFQSDSAGAIYRAIKAD